MSQTLEDLIWETRRLFRALVVAADEALQPLGIKASDRALLEFLAREKQPISLAELARKRSVSRQHIHQSLSRLKNPRLIERTPDPNDARSVLLRLTEEGRSLWKEIRKIDHVVLRHLARDVDAGKAQAATKTLRGIRETLERKKP
jgi:DNA-binding MarR family transcriptional regulator